MGDTREGRVLRYDYILIVCVLLLAVLGLVTLYSASYLFALNQPHRFSDGGLAPLRSNLWAFGIGMVFFIFILKSGLDSLKRRGVVMVLVLFTLAVNLVPFLKPFQMPSADGESARIFRWVFLRFGGRIFSFQPSEMIKIVLPLYLAYILDKKKGSYDSMPRVLLPSVFWTGLFCTVVLLQGNFSETMFLAIIALVVCFVGGMRLREIFAVLLVLIIFVFLLYTNDSEGKIKSRIDDFSRRKGYQVELSLDAVKSGHFLGKGIGQGTLKVKTPEIHGDFVFASFAEESGFLGVLLYFALFGFFVCIGFREAWRNQSRFSQLLGIALVTAVVTQTLMNLAVVAGLIPVTGVPLPFISSGGSSFLMTLVSAGLIVNVSRQNYIDRR